MKLLSLNLKNFRNFKEAHVSFHPQFNLIIGKNAQGKTNFLEAIYYLSFLKSFRTSDKTDLMYQKEATSLLEAVLEKEGLDYRIQISLDKNSRSVRVNGKKPNLFRDYYGLVPILLFEPHDVYLLRASPSVRRQYLGRALFLEDPLFLKIQRDYETVVANKNKLLKEGFGLSPELEVWNEKLAALGARIIVQRFIWMEKINAVLGQEYRRLSNGQENAILEYFSSISSKEKVGRDEKQIRELLVEAIQTRTDEELKRREALVGPHRDDWAGLVDGRDLAQLGSQGENRTMIIALKSAQVRLFQESHNYPPLFLLDDVASELDEARVGALFSYLRETQGQVFLTTTEPRMAEDFFKDKGSRYTVEGGRITS